MKASNILLACLFIALACSTPETESSASRKYAHLYSMPEFPDSTAFDRLKKTFPIVEKIYKDQMEKNHYPAIAFGIIANGKLIYSGGLGYSNLDQKTQATPQSLFRIASMSKSFTAMAILKLRDEGKLSLHDPVSKYIPEMTKSASLTSDAPLINIQHLLTMSAGFPEDNPWGDRQLADSDEDLIQLISHGISFSNVPGVNYEYSNLGFAMLGNIVTRVSGIPYQKYITENIMKPIGMNDSKWEYDEVPKEKLARGYRWEDETWKEEALLHDGSYGAMGGLICSIEDFSKYVALHLSAWPPRNGEETGPVKRSTIREMHQPWRIDDLNMDAKNSQDEDCPNVNGYGYGLAWRKDCTGKVKISHGGGLPGFGSEWSIYPEYGIGVVSLSNRTYAGPRPANAKVLDTLISIAHLQPRKLYASEVLRKRKSDILKAFKTWDGSNLSIFAENFFLDYSKEKWKIRIDEMFNQAGSIRMVSEVKAENQLRGSFLIRCEREFVEVFFTLTPEAEPLVQALSIQIFDKEAAPK